MKEPEVLKLKLKIQRHSNIITLVQDGYHQDRIIKLYPRNCYWLEEKRLLMNKTRTDALVKPQN